MPDDNFEQRLIDIGYDDALNDSVLATSIDGAIVLDVGDFDFSDLTETGFRKCDSSGLFHE